MARPKATNPQVHAGIYCPQSDLDYLLTWNPASSTLAFSELIETLRKIWPEGRYSRPNIDPATRNAPGTKTSLKRRIKALEAQLRTAGISPSDPDA